MRSILLLLTLTLSLGAHSQSWIPHWQGADYNQAVRWLPGTASAFAGHDHFFYRVNDFGASYSLISSDPLWQYGAIDFLNETQGWAIRKNEAFEWYAASTTDGGETWTTGGLIPDFNSNPVLAVQSPGLMLCGLGQKVFRSTDGGLSWTQVFFAPQGVQGLYWKNNVETWCASVSGLVYRSLDAGVNWSVVAAGLGSNPVDDIRFTAPNTVWVAAGGSGGIIRKSTDGGTNWSTIIPGVSQITAFEAFTDQHLLVASVNEIKESLNGGANWTTVHTWQYSRLQGRISTALNGLKVVTGFGGQVYRQNADNTWTEINAGSPVFNQASFINDLQGWAAATDHFSARLFNTTDGGVTWHLANAPAGANFVDFATASVGFCTTNNGFFRTDDGGQTWVQKASYTGYTKTVVVDAQHVRLLLNNATIQVTNDGGETWQQGVFNNPPPVAAFPFYDMEFTSPTAGYLAGDSGPSAQATAFYTTDGGLTWSKYTNFPNGPDLPEVVYLSASTGIYSTLNTLYKTTTSGASWSTINVPGLSGAYLANMYFRNLTQGWATAGSTLRKTINGGSTWTNVSEFWMADQTFGHIYHPTDEVGYMTSSLGFVRWGDAPCALPAFTASLDQNTVQVCAGNTAFISFNSGTSGLAVQWIHDGQVISTDNTLSLPNVQPSDNGTYECHLTNTNGCGTFTVVLMATLDVVTAISPAVQTSANDLTLCTGETLILNATVDIGNPINFVWYRDGQSIGTGASLTINDIGPVGTGTYHCEALVSTVCGSVTAVSQNFEVEVGQTFNLTVFEPSPEEFVCEGEPITMQVIAFGYSPVQYNWTFDGQTVGTQSNLSIAAATPDQQGTYTLEVSASNVCMAQTFAYQIQLYVAPLADVTVPDGQTFSTCLSSDISFFYAITADEGTEYYINWLHNGAYIAFGQEVTLNDIGPVDFGDYYAEVTYFGPCNSMTATYLAFTLTESTGGPDLTPAQVEALPVVCPGDQLEWVFDSPVNIDSYEWTFNGEIMGTAGSLSLFNLNTDDEGAYYCQVSAADACGNTTATFLMFTLDVNTDLPEITGPAQPANYSICTGAPFVLAFNSIEPMDSYLWTLNSTPVGNEAVLAVDAASQADAGLYVCTVTASNNCTTAEASFEMANLTVTTLPVITPPLPLSDQVVCAGEDAVISFAPADGISSFVWAGPGINVQTLNPLELSDVETSDSGVYSCTVSMTNNCGTVTETFEITNLIVSVAEVPVIEVQENQLQVQNDYSSYAWYNSGTLISTDSIAQTTGAGTYWVIVTNEYGCMAESTHIDIMSVSEAEGPFAMVFPNPFSDKLTIVSDSPLQQAELKDAAGRTIKLLDLGQMVSEIHTLDLAAGVYILKFTMEDISRTIKVIKPE